MVADCTVVPFTSSGYSRQASSSLDELEPMLNESLDLWPVCSPTALPDVLAYTTTGVQGAFVEVVGAV